MSSNRDNKPFKYLSNKDKEGKRQEKVISRTREKDVGTDPGYFAERDSSKYEGKKKYLVKTGGYAKDSFVASPDAHNAREFMAGVLMQQWLGKECAPKIVMDTESSSIASKFLLNFTEWDKLEGHNEPDMNSKENYNSFLKIILASWMIGDTDVAANGDNFGIVNTKSGPRFARIDFGLAWGRTIKGNEQISDLAILKRIYDDIELLEFPMVSVDQIQLVIKEFINILNQSDLGKIMRERAHQLGEDKFKNAFKNCDIEKLILNLESKKEAFSRLDTMIENFKKISSEDPEQKDIKDLIKFIKKSDTLNSKKSHEASEKNIIGHQEINKEPSVEIKKSNPESKEKLAIPSDKNPIVATEVEKVFPTKPLERSETSSPINSSINKRSMIITNPNRIHRATTKENSSQQFIKDRIEEIERIKMNVQNRETILTSKSRLELTEKLLLNVKQLSDSKNPNNNDELARLLAEAYNNICDKVNSSKTQFKSRTATEILNVLHTVCIHQGIEIKFDQSNKSSLKKVELAIQSKHRHFMRS